jgi:hypothetical protein
VSKGSETAVRLAATPPALRAGQAIVTGGDAFHAAREAVERARANAGGEADLLLVFATGGYDPPAVQRGALAAAADAPVFGGGVAALLGEGRRVGDGVGALALAGVRARVVASAGLSGDARRVAGTAAAEAWTALEDACADGRPRGVALLALPDATAGHAADVVRGIDRALGASVPLAGGGTGDAQRFHRTWQFAGERAVTDGIAVCALAADGPLGIGLRHGCEPIGGPLTVTRSRGRRLEELDWLPALGPYAAALGCAGGAPGDFFALALAHPIGFPQGERDFVLRSVLQLDPDGALGCCTEVPESGVVCVMRGTEASLLAAARQAAREAVAGLRGHAPAAALVFSCVSRLPLMTAAGAELAAVREGLGADVPVFGCHTFGEIGRLNGGPAQAHSGSIVVCALPATASAAE